MRLNLVGPFVVNAPFGTEIAFAKGLRRIGVDVVEIDPNLPECRMPDRFADATVVFKSCVGREAEMLQTLKQPIVVYQPDDARFPHIREMMLGMRAYADLFLSFDEYGSRVALTMGYRDSETLLLTADDELYRPADVGRDIDVSFVGSFRGGQAHTSRRYMWGLVQEYIRDRGLKGWFGETYFRDDPTPAQVYQRSKVVLNHATDVGQQFGYGFGLQCRHFEVGMTRTALLSNIDMSHELPALGNVVNFFDETSLVLQLDYLLEEDNWRRHGEMLYEEVTRGHLPEHRAQQLVDFIERNS